MQLSQNIVDFLQKPNFMMLATLREDGAPHCTIVWFEFAEGAIKFSTTTETKKYKNMTRDPRVAVVVFDRNDPYRYVEISGTVSEMTKDHARDYIDTLSVRYEGEPYPKDPERKEDRVTISIFLKSHFAEGFD
jgi:PPOX class probable F420-dependent enzyme